MIAFILNEKKKNNSLFNNYFKTLPNNFSTFPINYNKEEKELLKESFFFKRLIKFEKDVNKTFKSLRKTELNLNYSEFLPIYLLIQSRSFGLDTAEKTIDALVPFADMFNTSLNPKPCFWYFDDENNFIAQSTRAISKGEEINIRYNEGYNTDYLLYYGFTIGNNQNGHIYDFEIKLNTNYSDIYLSEENKSIYFTDLNIIPSLKYLNIQKFRKFYENSNGLLDEKLNYYSNSQFISCHINDVEMFKLIKREILQSLKKYPSDIFDFHEKSSNSTNIVNIKRILDEEKKVLVKNLTYFDKLIESFEKKDFESLYEKFEIKSYYDTEYLNSCKKMFENFI